MITPTSMSTDKGGADPEVLTWYAGRRGWIQRVYHGNAGREGRIQIVYHGMLEGKGGSRGFTMV